MRKVLVTPKEGCRVRDDLSGIPLPDGEATEVEFSTYWFRKESAGDVTIEEIEEAEPVRSAPTVSRESDSIEE